MILQPGELVREYARRRNWPLLRHNIMVEGTSDVGYFRLVSDLYAKKSGRSLVGDDLAVFPPGVGDEGGTHGMQLEFPTLRRLIDQDLSDDSKRLFHMVALVDGDSPGKQAARSLTGSHTSFQACRDVFVLQRVFPSVPGETKTVQSAFERANLEYRGLDCEIEDLIAPELVDSFIEEQPNCRPPPARVAGNARHFNFASHAKPMLLRYVAAYAVLDDLLLILEIIKALRFYLKLDPVGFEPAQRTNSPSAAQQAAAADRAPRGG